MKSPEMRMGEPKESPKTEATTKATPLSEEMKTEMQEEVKKLWAERRKLQETAVKKFARIVGTEPGDETLKGAKFKGVEVVRDIIEYHGDSTVLQALKDLTVPSLLKFGTLGKVKRWANSPEVDWIIAIDNRIGELEKMYK